MGDLIGRRTDPEGLSDRAIASQAEFYALRSALLSESKHTQDGRDLISVVERFAKRLPTYKGLLGTLYLISAANEVDAKEETAALELARKYFAEHACPSCAFGDAVAAGRLFELAKERGESQDKLETLRTKTKSSLQQSLGDLESCPMKIDIAAIEQSPPLSCVKDDDEIVIMYEKYNWRPTPGSTPPIDFLWNNIPPLLEIRFPYQRALLKKE